MFHPLRWAAAVLVAAVAATYASGLNGPFILDDQATVVQNPSLRNPTWDSLLRPAADSPVAGRPLANLTFVANFAIGGTDVRGYRVVNVALHAASAVLVLLVAARTAPIAVAFTAALLWGLHPLASEVVNYVTQRTESLMAICYLLTLYAAACAFDAHGLAVPAAPRGRTQPRRRGDVRRSGRVYSWETLAVLACAAGMATKEAMVTAPVMVALFDRVFLFSSWRDAVRARRRLYAGLAATWVLLLVLNAGGPRAAVAGFSSGVSSWTYLLNQAEIILAYLRLTIWPDALVVFYGWPRPLGFSDVAVPFLVLAGLAALTVGALWRWPKLGFLGAWFFITLAPTSSIVPVATEVGAERRMYLPLMALAVLAAVGMHRILRQDPRRTVAAGAAAAVVLAMATVARTAEYQSPITLARTVVERRPTGVAHHILAEQLIVAGHRDEAVTHLRRAVALGNTRANYPLGSVLVAGGESERAEAVARLQAFLATANPPRPLVPRWLEPAPWEVADARAMVAQVYARSGDWERAMQEARAVLELAPRHPGAHGLLGDAAFLREDWARAAEHYRAYLASRPADTKALLNFGITQVAVDDYVAAIDAFTRVTRLEPNNARAHELLRYAHEDKATAAAGK